MEPDQQREMEQKAKNCATRRSNRILWGKPGIEWSKILSEIQVKSPKKSHRNHKLAPTSALCHKWHRKKT
jgi:hypothetical protein